MPRSRTGPARALQALALVALLCVVPACAQQVPLSTLQATSNSFVSEARKLIPGGRLRIQKSRLEGEATDTTLELERFEIWSPNAKIEVQTRSGTVTRPVPNTMFFRGNVSGEPGARALMAVGSDGTVSGLVMKAGGAWALGKGSGLAGSLQSRQAKPSEFARKKKPFLCGADHKHALAMPVGGGVRPKRGARKLQQFVADQQYAASIAVETDYEFYAKFLNQPDPVAAALDYAASLFGYADFVFSKEIGVDMAISYIRLWTNGPSSDPYPTTTDSVAALYKFRDYWNANMRGQERTLAHMLSGMSTGGGVAWVGQLCGWYANKGDNVAYGYSGALGGDFSWNGDQKSNPQSVVWDVMVVMHEIGHNFNSPHTQDYCDLGGNASPVDRCYEGCLSEGSLPTCTGPVTAYRSGSGVGTIMSYCHLRDGGMGNMAMTFGTNHPCGVAPGRVPARMRSHVLDMASAYPQCLRSRRPSPPASPPPSPRPPKLPSPRPPSPSPPADAGIPVRFTAKMPGETADGFDENRQADFSVLLAEQAGGSSPVVSIQTITDWGDQAPGIDVVAQVVFRSVEGTAADSFAQALQGQPAWLSDTYPGASVTGVSVRGNPSSPSRPPPTRRSPSPSPSPRSRPPPPKQTCLPSGSSCIASLLCCSRACKANNWWSPIGACK